jgi:hypothetical protein
MGSTSKHYSPGIAPFSTEKPAAIPYLIPVLSRQGAALGCTNGDGRIGQTWKRGGCDKQGNYSQSQQESFHGRSPLRKSSHRDKLLVKEGFSGFS